MRAVIQRVLRASVDIEDKAVGMIENGLLVYLGVSKADSEKDACFMADKLAGLRIFADAEGKMNLSVADVGGGILLVSNFTLYGDCRKGKRPGFDLAAEPKPAKELYERVGSLMEEQGIEVERGVFGAHMHISSVNDGPVTFVLDSREPAERDRKLLSNSGSNADK